MLKPEFDTIETTYADLRPTDKIVAKDGTIWPIAGLVGGGSDMSCSFWLCDPQTGVRLHLMAKPKSDPVTVERIPTHADDVAKAEADFPPLQAQVMVGPVGDFDFNTAVTVAEEVGAIKVLKEVLGATVEAEVTAEETDAARQATEEQPVELPVFESMTGLEQNTHLYLFHSVISYDLVSTARRIEMHTQAHADYAAGKLNARQIPHRHA